jgi:hypothetical protein
MPAGQLLYVKKQKNRIEKKRKERKKEKRKKYLSFK